MIQSYRKKPVVIQAVQLTDSAPGNRGLTDWMVSHGYEWLVGNALEPHTLRLIGEPDEVPTKGIWIDPVDGMLAIRTLEGDMKVSLFDYVIQGVNGEFYPCKPDIFAKTYEAVSHEEMTE